MYESYYSLSDKPFRLRPDPSFFFNSKGHQRAMAYLEYGLSQGEGFIVITGEVGAGKTTLVRHMFSRPSPDKVVAAHIVNTLLDSDDVLRMVVAGFGLPHGDTNSKTILLGRLETFLRQCEADGRQALLLVDEAQNLAPSVVEELRMLSNFQTHDKSLLQTFLLGQPEFRATLMSPAMQQLRQRVIATYHLGPMDEQESQAYIEHRLRTVGWQGDPAFTPGAFAAIYSYAGGIPRKTNHLCDRLLLLGFLEELHEFTGEIVATVVSDIEQEFTAPPAIPDAVPGGDLNPPEIPPAMAMNGAAMAHPDMLDARMLRLERSLSSVLSLLKKVVRNSEGNNLQLSNRP